MLESKFNQVIEEWMVYCNKPEVQFSSSVQPVRDCEFYRAIVSMGFEALPLIRRLYERNDTNIEMSVIQAHGLIGVVKEIVGDNFQIPTEIQGRVNEIKAYTKNWLDSNMSEYLKN